jgi:quercetin dioxygenase-like cupin family protein
MESTKDPRLDVERQSHHLVRPGFRIAETTINATQKVPWHYHSNVKDSFYVLEGQIRLFLRDPKQEIRLAPGETFSVKPRRPHMVVNGGETAATFLVLQGIGEYDFVSLT